MPVVVYCNILKIICVSCVLYKVMFNRSNSDLKINWVFEIHESQKHVKNVLKERLRKLSKLSLLYKIGNLVEITFVSFIYWLCVFVYSQNLNLFIEKKQVLSTNQI